jgi:hypothetical protein
VAAEHGHTDVGRFLIDAGADLTHCIKDVIAFGVIGGHANFIAMLLETNVDPEMWHDSTGDSGKSRRMRSTNHQQDRNDAFAIDERP